MNTRRRKLHLHLHSGHLAAAVSRVTYSQYICHKRETTTSPSMQQNELKIITAICQRFFKCISAVIEVRRYGRTSAYILYFLFVWGWEGQGEVSTNESCVFFWRQSVSAVLTLVVSSFLLWGSRTGNRGLFALSDGATSRPADVEERSSLSVWSDQGLEVDGAVLITALTSSTRNRKPVEVTEENLGRLFTTNYYSDASAPGNHSFF